jgi:large subunit ribosomal protein L25
MVVSGTALSVTPREKIGKANRRLAAENKIPVVLYGPDRDPMPLALDRHEFELFAAHHAAGSTLVDLEIEGQKKRIAAMIREVQRSPVKGTVLHIDFLEVAMNKPVQASITLHLVNDPAGVRAGGILTVNLHEVNIEALPGDLPEILEVDVSALELGDLLLISDVKPPAGVTMLDDPEAVVASVQTPRVEIEEEAAEEMAEPELIGKGEAEQE